MASSGCATVGPEGWSNRVDADHDGYVAAKLGGTDCRDDAAEIHPGAQETWYDGVDQDCSGGSDYDADGDGFVDPLGGGNDCDDANAGVYPGVIYFQDADSDGWGDIAVPVDACSGLGVPESGDCDDADFNLSPVVTELCDVNDVDEDCDGFADDNDDGPSGQGIWYPDADRDGYGDGTDVLRACDAPAGYVGQDGDCDDADSQRTPNRSWFADLDGDGFGDPSVGVTACDPGSDWVLDESDCDDTDSTVYPGAGEGCFGGDRDCDALLGTADPDLDPIEASWWVDADGDGYGDPDLPVWTCDPVAMVQNDTDCDDGESGVHPLAAEVCDAGDNDCDGRVDDSDTDVEGRPDWYRDADADGWGLAASSLQACFQPGGYVAMNGDCDDSAALVHPDGQEVCGSGDEDCDGLSDDADASVMGTLGWYTDTDEDGFGVASSLVLACVSPAGTVEESGDCDDENAEVSPAGVENCAAAADENCDGDTNDIGALGCVDFLQDDDADGWGTATSQCVCVAAAPWAATESGDCDDTNVAVSPAGVEDCATEADDDCDGETNAVNAVGCSLWYADLDRDGFGAGAAVCQCAASESADSNRADDCDDGDASSQPDGRAVVLDGADNNCDGLADIFDLGLADAVWIPSVAYTAAGSGLAAGDIDGDGLDDLVVSGPSEQNGGFSSGERYGQAWLIPGSVNGTARLDDERFARFNGETAGDYAGRNTAFVGDVDNDGIGDMLVGASYLDVGRENAGGVYLVSGATRGEVSLSTALARLIGEAAEDRIGRSLAGQIDLNADGQNDLLVGNANAGTKGRVYGVFGAVAGDFDLAAADFVLGGEHTDDAAGHAVAVAGDMDGDGLDDVAVGAPDYDEWGVSKGCAYVLSGPFSSGSMSLSAADGRFFGERSDDSAGAAVESAGDLNGDGYDDLLIGASWPDANGIYAGAAYLVYGPAVGDKDLSAADASLRGAAGDCAGQTLAGGQDLTGDGQIDVVVGGYCANTDAVDSGVVWVVDGAGLVGEQELKAAADIFYGEGEFEWAGYSLAVGEFNGDGVGDLAIGAPYSWAGAMESGAVYVVHGGPQ